MKTDKLTLSAKAVSAIEALQHPCGTFEFYHDTLSRLFNFVLNNGDEMGMDAQEMVSTLRALHYLKADLSSIAGKSRTALLEIEATEEDIAEKVEALSSAVDDLEDSDANSENDSQTTDDEE